MYYKLNRGYYNRSVCPIKRMQAINKMLKISKITSEGDFVIAARFSVRVGRLYEHKDRQMIGDIGD